MRAEWAVTTAQWGERAHQRPTRGALAGVSCNRDRTKTNPLRPKQLAVRAGSWGRSAGGMIAMGGLLFCIAGRQSRGRRLQDLAAQEGRGEARHGGVEQALRVPLRVKHVLVLEYPPEH